MPNYSKKKELLTFLWKRHVSELSGGPAERR
jgi:hypothetical protein